MLIASESERLAGTACWATKGGHTNSPTAKNACLILFPESVQVVGTPPYTRYGGREFRPGARAPRFRAPRNLRLRAGGGQPYDTPSPPTPPQRLSTPRQCPAP